MPDAEGLPTPEEVAAETREFTLRIIGGDFDGQLVEIAKACGTRAQLGPLIKWKLDLDDLHVTEDDVTFPEMVQWSTVAGRSWIELRPLDQDIGMCNALLVVLCHTRLGLDEDGVRAKLDSWTARQVIDAFSQYEVDPLPLDESDPG